MTTFATLYDIVITRLKTVEPDVSFNVTQYALTVGDANATTGIPAITYGEGATIEMVILSKAASQILQGTGLYIRRDALGLTKTAVAEGDRIKDADDHIYTVVSVAPNPVGDVMAYYQADLTYNPML